jgi:hypothetical protein
MKTRFIHTETQEILAQLDGYIYLNKGDSVMVNDGVYYVDRRAIFNLNNHELNIHVGDSAPLN